MHNKFISINNFISEINLEDIDLLQNLFDARVNRVFKNILRLINHRKSLSLGENPSDFVLEARNLVKNYKLSENAYNSLKRVLQNASQNAELYKFLIIAGLETAKRRPINAEPVYLLEIFLEELEHALGTRNVNKIWSATVEKIAGFKNNSTYSKHKLAAEIENIFINDQNSLFYPLTTIKKLNSIAVPLTLEETAEFIAATQLSAYFPEEQDRLFLCLFLNANFIQQRTTDPLHNSRLENYYELLFVFYQIKNDTPLNNLNNPKKDIIKVIANTQESAAEILKTTEMMLTEIKNYLTVFRERYQTNEALKTFLEAAGSDLQNYGLLENIRLLFENTDKKAKTVLNNEFKQLSKDFDQDVIYKLVISGLSK